MAKLSNVNKSIVILDQTKAKIPISLKDTHDETQTWNVFADKTRIPFLILKILSGDKETMKNILFKRGKQEKQT